MESKNIIEKVKFAAKNGAINPTDRVWQRLEKKLDSGLLNSSVPPPRVRLLKINFMSIAASVVVLIGLGTWLLFFPMQNEGTLAVELEDLHTLEINPEFNAPKVGDATTLPSILFAEPLLTTYNHINEGVVGKKLMERSQVEGISVEFGLG